MKTIIRSAIVLTVLLFTISSVHAQKSVTLKYNLNVGDQYEFVTELDQEVSFDANGQTMTLDQDMIFNMASNVTSVTNEEIAQEIKFEKVEMTQAIFGMELHYNSADSTTWTGMGAQIAEEMNKLINKPISYVMDERGNIKDLDISSISDNDDLSNNLTSGNTYAVYPEGKVKVGESWETDIEPLKDSDMTVHMKYTLLKATKKQVTLGLEGTLKANEINSEDMELNGTTVGEMIVDTKTGMLISSKMDIELAVELEQQGMKIPANILSTTVTTCQKK